METDTHWNQSGAYVASKLINERIKTLLPRDSYIDYSYDTKQEEAPFISDNVRLLALSHWRKATYPVYTPHDAKWTDIYTYIKDDSVNGVITQNKNPSLPKAVIFRDSMWG